jgi:hypothetical protein
VAEPENRLVVQQLEAGEERAVAGGGFEPTY